MCGICGYRSKQNVPLEKMIAVLEHRGPDDSGLYTSGTVGLGHRRLSIIDIAGGHQPFVSADGQVCLVFNGVIYNYRELKKDLTKKGFDFVTSSDTEVLLQMYVCYGKEMLHHLNGQFAFVIYDARENLLFGARDRLGIKPFYYSINNNGLFFASEIKALFKSGFVPSEVYPAAVDMYFTYRYVPGNITIYKNIFKLLPAHAFEQVGDKAPSFWKYWDIPEEPLNKSYKTVIEEFDELLNDSVNYRLISDVPLGVFLSGGVDSTTIIAIMSQLGHTPIHSYTVGFDNVFDETEEASRSANYYGCDHHELKVSGDAFELLPKIIWHMDEPFGDSILLPLYMLSKKASDDIKVVLTGEGADEGQMGYVHHEALSKGFSVEKWLPSMVLLSLGYLIKRMPVSVLDSVFNYPGSMGVAGRERFGQLASCLSSPGKAYQLLTSLFTESEKNALYGPVLMKGKEAAEEEYYKPLIDKLDNSNNPLRDIYLHDLKNWLPDNILNKQDRMTMAHSLEGRVPFLDHRIVEFEAGLPHDLKIRKGHGKYVLNTLFKKRYSVPGRKSRRKNAFFFPIEGEYKRSYQKLVDRYLRSSIPDDDLFNKREVLKIIDNAERSPLLEHKKVMALIIFQIWLEVFNPQWT